ncbi:MAG: helical backbone metal receptor [Balneolaceae bacterium]
MPPQKIISLVPSLTELLFDLGIGNSVIGRTRFCVHPEKEVQNVPIIGGTKNPRIDKIKALQPGLIIANKEENHKEDIEELEVDFRVLVTDISTIEEALFAIHEIGAACDVPQQAKKLIKSIQSELQNIPDEPPLSAAYFIWRRPWMSVGRDTYIHSVLDRWNLENVFSDRTRYPETTLEELSSLSPDLIMLSSEPFPFKEKHIAEVGKACPKSNIVLVNGEWFSWYGSRMLKSFRQLNILRKAIS